MQVCSWCRMGTSSRRDDGGGVESREISRVRLAFPKAAGPPRSSCVMVPGARLLPVVLALVVAGPAFAQGRFGIHTPAPAPPPAVASPGAHVGGPWVPRGAPPVVRPVPPPYVYGWGFGYRGWLWDPWWIEPVPVGPPTVVAPYGAYVAPAYPPYPPPSSPPAGV